MHAVFETELIGIDGVPKPESIVTKPTSSATSETPATEPTNNIVDFVKEKLDEVVKVAKNLLNPDDGGVEERAEL